MVRATADGAPFVIDSDVIRSDHPLMEDILAKDALRMDVLSNAVVGPVTEALLQYAREHKRSIILENTLTNQTGVANTISTFRRADYAVDVHVVATPAQISRIGIVDRYAKALAIQWAQPRWTSSFAHQTAYDAIPDGLVALHGLIDNITVASRQQGLVYEGMNAQEAAEVVERVRKEDWNEKFKTFFAEKYVEHQPLLTNTDFIAHPSVAPLVKRLDETAATIPEYVQAAQEQL